MSKTEKWIAFGFIIVIVLLFLISSTDLILKEFSIKPQKISIVSDDIDDENWQNYKKGMELAAKLFRIDVEFITLDRDRMESDQKRFIDEQIAAGAQAIITTPINSNKLEEMLAGQITNKVPMMVLEHSVEADNVFSCFKGDYQKMGQDLGVAITEDLGGIKKSALIIVHKNEVTNMKEYYFGLTEQLQKAGITYRELIWSNKEDLDKIFRGSEKILIGLEADSLKEIAQIYNRKIHSEYVLYGNGSNDTILSYLESGTIEAITLVNDFDMGFLSVLLTFNKLYGGEVNETVMIQHYLIRKETMYNKEYQKMLFPIS